MAQRMRGTGAAVALAGLIAAAGMPVRAAGLALIQPRDGATVREKVKIMVPASAIPPNGFASLFVDGLFHVAQAPPPNSRKPLTFLWDTKATLADTSLPEAKRSVQDGEHQIEVRTYTDDGRMAERAAVNVRVANRLPIREGQPIYLAYRFRVGDATKYAYRFDMKATGSQNSAGSAPTTLPEIDYREFDKITAFVEDVNNGQAFMRERRSSPITISFGDVSQPVPVDESSRYFTMTPTGHATMSTAMTREKRVPFCNQIYLPAHSVRVGQSWKGPVKIWAGTFSTRPVEFIATNTLEGIEWEHGVPTARIKSTYKGTARLDEPYAGVQDGLIDVKGTSILHVAPSTGKIMRAVHEMEGTLKLDTSQGAPGGSTGGYGAPGGYTPPGYGAPGGYGGPPGGAPGYSAPGGAPGYGAPGGAPGYSAPGGGPPGYGGPGGAPGYGAPGGYGTPGAYDPTANQGGPIPGVPVYATYSLKIRAVTTIA